MADTSPPPLSSSSLLSALDFFRKDDPAVGVDKFKTVAFRALHEQRLDDELRATKSENERLTREHAALAKQLSALQRAFETNVDDRERVLAFKSKRIEALNLRLQETEAINASLLQTISGSDVSLASQDAAGVRAAMVALLQTGKPLFHALATCKEREFRDERDAMRLQCEQLTAELQAQAASVDAMRAFERDRAAAAAQTAALEAQLQALAAAKDDAVHFLERKLVFEHDRLRREKVADVQACERDLAAKMQTQLDATTQRTIAENARVQLELRYQSAQIESLVAQLDRATAETKALKQNARIVDDMNVTLSRRVKFYEQLFAKMQHKEQLLRQHDSVGDSSVAESSPSGRIHSPRKPPLPALDTPVPRGRLSQSVEDDSVVVTDSEWHRTLADSGEQLNSAAQALDAHLQQRAFARKQVDAMLQLHVQQQQPRVPAGGADRQRSGVFMGPAPLVKKKIVLAKVACAPTSYQRGRKVFAIPTTLDAFVRQHAAISPRQRAVPARHSPRDDALRNDSSSTGDSTVATVLPGLGSLQSQSQHQQQDRSEMWRLRAPDDAPATARF